MRLKRRLTALAIVGFWLAMVGWQVRREYFQPQLTQLAEASEALAPGVEFYTLRMGGRSVGLATSKLDTVPDGFELEDLMTLDLPAMGQTGSAVARTRVTLSPALVMKEFSFSLDSDVGKFSAEGRIQGDSVLDVTLHSAGSTDHVSYPMEQPPVFSSVLPIRVAMGHDLEVGRKVRFPVFDPSSMSTRAVEVRVEDHDTLVVPDSVVMDSVTGRWKPAHYDTIPSWKVAEVYGGVEVESWVDEDGRIVRASSPLGFTMERTEYELARQAQEDARGMASSPVDNDVILSTAIQSNVDLGNVEEYEELRFRLTGVDLEGFDLAGGRQELRGDTLIVRREDWDGIESGYDLPYKRMDLKEDLEPEPLIQSADERIVEAARSAAEWRFHWHHDPKRVAAALTRNVYGRLKKVITFSVPSAVQVLESGQGDCNEHTVLYVAMARALGLPARTAVGLVYVNGSFFYHAWPEVWLAGRWVAVDPTFGEVPADAAHIRFVNGGLAQQVEIVRLIGNLHIEVVGQEPLADREDR